MAMNSLKEFTRDMLRWLLSLDENLVSITTHISNKFKIVIEKIKDTIVQRYNGLN